MIACDRGSVAAKLKQEVSELKASCMRLANQPDPVNAGTVQRWEREVQQARRKYDQVLEKRRKQAADLEQLITKVQELGTTAAVEPETAVQRQARHLQAQITNTAKQVTDALSIQLEYQDVLQQLKQGHAEFNEQLEQCKSELQVQQEQVKKARTRLLQAQHARDAAKRELAAAEQELAAGRLNRTGIVQQLQEQCHAHLQQQLQPQQQDISMVEQQQELRGEEEGSEYQQLQHSVVPMSSRAVHGLSQQQQSREELGPPPGSRLNAADYYQNEDCEPYAFSRERTDHAFNVHSSSDGTSAVQHIQQLLASTSCCTPRELVLHVHALLKAADSLQEAASAAAEKLDAAEQATQVLLDQVSNTSACQQ